jgi:enoyl-CoA hydratase
MGCSSDDKGLLLRDPQGQSGRQASRKCHNASERQPHRAHVVWRRMTFTDHLSPPTEPRMGILGLLEIEPPAHEVIDRVAIQRHVDVAVVTLSHPAAHNALTLASWRRLRAIFDELASDASLRAVVLRGAGGRAFAAGADIKEFPHVRMTAAQAAHYDESISAALGAIAALPVPVIAAVRGMAVGGGCELSAACDVRIAAEDARFGIPIGKLGVILGYTEAEVAARLIGPAGLKYLLFSAELIPASEALRLGLVQKVVAVSDLAAETAKLVMQICRQSRTTMLASKAVVDMTGRALTAADTNLITLLTVEAYEGEDLKEGVAAFNQGREPAFRTRKVN